MKQTAGMRSSGLSALFRRRGRRLGEHPRTRLRRSLLRRRSLLGRSLRLGSRRLLLRFAWRQRFGGLFHVIGNAAFCTELSISTKFYFIVSAFPSGAHPQLRNQRANIFFAANVG